MFCCLFLFPLKIAKANSCFRMFRDNGEMKINKMKSKCFDYGRGKCLPFVTCTKTFIVMMTLMVTAECVLGDDTKALQNTLSSLCSLNKEGKFGSCCENYDISSVTLASSVARGCFIHEFSSTDSSIITFLLKLIYLKYGPHSFSEAFKAED